MLAIENSATAAEFSYSGMDTAAIKNSDNTVNNVVRKINNTGSALRQKAQQLADSRASNDEIRIQPRFAWIANVALAIVESTGGLLRAHSSHYAHQDNASSLAMQPADAYAASSSSPVTAMPYSLDYASQMQVVKRATLTPPPENISYSARNTQWLTKNAIQLFPGEELRTVSNEFAEKNITILKSPKKSRNGIFVAQIQDKLIKVEPYPYGTLNIVFAVDKNIPHNNQEIEFKKGKWVFVGKTDKIISTELIEYIKYCEDKGLIKSTIPRKKQLSLDNEGLRVYGNQTYTIIRGGYKAIAKENNKTYLLLRTPVNIIPILITKKHNQYYLKNLDVLFNGRGEPIIDSSISLQQKHLETYNKFQGLINQTQKMLDNVSQQITAMSAETFKEHINSHLKTDFTIQQATKLMNRLKNIEGLKAAFHRKFDNSEEEKNKMLLLNFIHYPERGAGEFDQLANTQSGTINIYPKFFHESPLMQAITIFRIYFVSLGAKDFYRLNNTKFSNITSPLDRLEEKAYSHIIQAISEQFGTSNGMLRENSTLLTGKDSLIRIEKEYPEFMENQFWRSFAAKEQSKQSRNPQTLLEYNDSLESHRMPQHIANVITRSDRHYLKKSQNNAEMFVAIILSFQPPSDEGRAKNMMV